MAFMLSWGYNWLEMWPAAPPHWVAAGEELLAQTDLPLYQHLHHLLASPPPFATSTWSEEGGGGGTQFYLLYWYKSTNADVVSALLVQQYEC